MNTATVSTVLIVLLALGAILFLYFARRLWLQNQSPSRTRQAAPVDTSALIVRAYAKRDSGDTAGALADFRTVLQRQPDHPDAIEIRAEIERLSQPQSSNKP